MFFGNPSGTPAEIKALSRRTPEELPKNFTTNTEVILEKSLVPYGQ